MTGKLYKKTFKAFYAPTTCIDIEFSTENLKRDLKALQKANARKLKARQEERSIFLVSIK
jgi:hypothetical protein